MSEFIYPLTFFLSAAFVGTLSFVPALTNYRRQLLGSGAFFLLSGFALIAGSHVPPVIRGTADGSAAMRTVFKVTLWIAATLLCAALLDFIFSRWIFPGHGRPKKRKLFADLVLGFVYFVAGAGILSAVLGPSFEGLLATSGIIAIVVGLALQSTLADLFAGVALNIERPFQAGEWISVSGGPEGQIDEINWRATRLKTRMGDFIVIPNSVLAKSVVTNRSRPTTEHVVGIGVTFANAVDPDVVTEILLKAGQALSLALPDPPPSVSLLSSSELGITYELDLYVKNFADTPTAASEALREIWRECERRGISLAVPLREIRAEESGGTQVAARLPAQPERSSLEAEPKPRAHSPARSLRS